MIESGRLRQLPVDESLRKFVEDFRLVGEGFANAHLVVDWFAEDAGDSEYLVVPVLMVVGDPQEWDSRRTGNIPKSSAGELVSRLEELVAKLASAVQSRALNSQRIVFFQLGDFIPTLKPLRCFSVFKNSARSGSDDLPFPYFVAEKSRQLKPMSNCQFDLSFRGAVVGVELRSALKAAFENYRSRLPSCFEESYHIQGVTNEREYQTRYWSLLEDSKFIACPRGTGLSSYRLFEAMACGRIPLILSDNYRLPGVVDDWGSCLLVVPESDLESIPDRIEEFARNNDLETVSTKLRAIFDEYFVPQRIGQYVAETLEY